MWEITFSKNGNVISYVGQTKKENVSIYYGMDGKKLFIYIF